MIGSSPSRLRSHAYHKRPLRLTWPVFGSLLRPTISRRAYHRSALLQPLEGALHVTGEARVLECVAGEAGTLAEDSQVRMPAILKYGKRDVAIRQFVMTSGAVVRGMASSAGLPDESCVSAVNI